MNTLAIVGYLVILVMMVMILKNKALPLFCFAVLPVIGAFCAGFSVKEVLEFVNKGVGTTWKTAVPALPAKRLPPSSLNNPPVWTKLPKLPADFATWTSLLAWASPPDIVQCETPDALSPTTTPAFAPMTPPVCRKAPLFEPLPTLILLKNVRPSPTRTRLPPDE